MKLTSKKLEKLGFMFSTRSVITGDEPTRTEVFYWYSGNSLDIKCDAEGYTVYNKDEQIGAKIGHVKISTIKDIIKQDGV